MCIDNVTGLSWFRNSAYNKNARFINLVAECISVEACAQQSSELAQNIWQLKVIKKQVDFTVFGQQPTKSVSKVLLTFQLN